MRKIILLFALCALVLSSFGQRAIPVMEKKVSADEAVQYFTPSEWKDFQSSKAFGDVIWSEDFGGGAIPTGWVSVDNSMLGHEWMWSNSANVGLSGQYSTNAGPMGSTTGNNGYMLLPGDHYNTGVTAFQDMDAYFQTSAINCDTAHSVMLKFEQYMRYCCGDGIFTVSISTNNVDWTDYDVLGGLAGNASSENPVVVYLNITPIAALQSTVYIKFYMGGVSHYFWAVDDLQLITAPQNEVKFTEDTYNYWRDITTGAIAGSFSKIPMSQLMLNDSEADVVTYGDQTQTNVTFTSSILDATGTQVYSETDDTAQLSFIDTAFFTVANGFTPTAPGMYSVALSVNQDEVDEIPMNNYKDTFNFEITTNNTFARDRRWNGGSVSIDNYTGGLDGDFIGVEYYIPNDDVLNSLSIFINYNTTPGTSVLGQAFLDDGAGSASLHAETDELVIEPHHIGTWVDLPFLSQPPVNNVVTAGSNYFVGVECYPGGEELSLNTDGEEYPHLLWYESKLRIGTDWYWIHELPHIRLNLDGATLMPEFGSSPHDNQFTQSLDVADCPENTVYEYYTATISDPQSLTLTVTAASNLAALNPVTVTDNGNGTWHISTAGTPQDAGLTVGDEFRIRITADNGTVSNEQYFWVTVIPPISISEAVERPVNIYPNPAQNVLYVQNAANATIEIYNLLGELVSSVENAETTSQINIDNLSAGTYVISIVKNNEVVTKKFNKI